MHDQLQAASQVATVKICANVSRIISEALAHWQRHTRSRIAVAESTKLPGWQYLVHSLLADESVATEFMVEVNKLHAALADEESKDHAYP